MSSKFAAALVSLVVLISAPTAWAAQTSNPAQKQLSAESFAALPSMERPLLSPNGKKIAAKLAIQGQQYFVVMSLDGGQPTVIQAGENDLNWWRWTNDDWLVVGIGRLLPVSGTEMYVTRAVGVSAADGKFVQLAAREAAQSADDVMWVARDGTPRILMASQTSAYITDRGFWPQVDEVDVSTGRRRMVVGGREDIYSWYADANGTVRMGIGMSKDGRESRVIYRDKDRGDFRALDTAKTNQEALTVPQLFLEEPGKALTIGDDERGFSTLYELDLTTLKRGKSLFSTEGYDIRGLYPDPAGFGYLGVLTGQKKRAVAWTDPAMVALQKELSSKIAGASPQIISTSNDRSVVVAQVGGSDAPGAYFLYTAADGNFGMLSVNNEAIGLKRMHPVRSIRYKARDGLEIEAILTLPRGKSKNLPLIVMPHGGPFARDYEEWDWWTQFLADRGYAVVQPNYRGSSGYGTAFAKKGEGQWGLAMQDDLNDAVTELARLEIADPKRVCMVGASYGGYAAMRAAQRDGALYRCSVSYAGVSELNRMIRHDAGFLGAGARKDWVKAQAPDLRSVSPLHDATSFSIPVLLMHGKKDRVVQISHSRDMANRLKEAGKEVIYIEQPEGDHYFSREEDRLQFLKEMESFLAKHNPA